MITLSFFFNARTGACSPLMTGIGAVFASARSGREAADLFAAASREPWVTLPTMACQRSMTVVLYRDLLLADRLGNP
jgi:hypothetical protein